MILMLFGPNSCPSLSADCMAGCATDVRSMLMRDTPCSRAGFWGPTCAQVAGNPVASFHCSPVPTGTTYRSSSRGVLRHRKTARVLVSADTSQKVWCFLRRPRVASIVTHVCNATYIRAEILI